MCLFNQLRFALFFLPAVCFCADCALGEEQAPVRDDTELEAFLSKATGIGIDLPALGYAWNEKDLIGDATKGALAVDHKKVIYYFIHWGPIEVHTITEAYVRQRIPKIWPGEGLEVKRVKPTEVAGHPAFYAQVIPKRAFYRAFFLIWNCEESGRQFIADMNYNVSAQTPKAELQAELDATEKTLACHEEAATSSLPTHPVRYDNPRYKIRFDHPVRWFVFDNPYGVPHPAYQGMRNHEVGSILAWLQDMEVKLRFDWEPKQDSDEEPQESMGVPLNIYNMALNKAVELEGIDDFCAEEYETLRIGSIPVLKITGTAIRSKPESKGLDRSPRVRLMVLVAESPKDSRLLFITTQIEYYLKNGVYYPPDRSILDRWAADLAKGLEF